MKRAPLWFLVVVLGLVGVFIYNLPTSHTATEPSHPLQRTGETALYPPAQMPGAIDPRITQANIQETICVAGYTRTVRPPVRFTNKLKRALIRQYGLPGTPSDYELDHIVPLALGGCADCLANLWMEPLDDAHEKDRVEKYLHREVCQNRITLQQAQKQIMDDWVAVSRNVDGDRKHSYAAE